MGTARLSQRLHELGLHKQVKGALAAPRPTDGRKHVRLVAGLEGARIAAAEGTQRLELLVRETRRPVLQIGCIQATRVYLTLKLH